MHDVVFFTPNVLVHDVVFFYVKDAHLAQAVRVHDVFFYAKMHISRRQ